MEKLCYVLWKPEATAMADFAAELRGPVAARIARRSLGPLSLLVADEATEPVAKARIQRTTPPVAGMLSLWLDTVDARGAVEDALAPATARLAGFLVTESVPIPNRTRRAAPGERTPGITMLSLLERPARLSEEDWLRIWHEHHTPLAMEIQCTYLYVRNVVVRPLSPGAPPWAGLVEEGFPTEAVTDPMLWYRAEGSPERLRENLGRMLASVRAFLDIERVESLPMSEWVLRGWSGGGGRPMGFSGR
jgi:hypothetical protein